jgi:hypothetical protein
VALAHDAPVVDALAEGVIELAALLAGGQLAGAPIATGREHCDAQGQDEQARSDHHLVLLY